MGLVQKALEEAKVTPKDISCIAYTKVWHCCQPSQQAGRAIMLMRATHAICCQLTCQNGLAGPRHGRASGRRGYGRTYAVSAVEGPHRSSQPLCRPH